ncbi:hypothetical protein [Kitasatospora sp. GAS204B]|uniref:hypothetical protein n=1 Tax=unclassified Kitasatospora TaxID=2633591 RepID=UPI0024751F05|nr:hypothetical protein [Kitasatospora sp. GAS204B]MDH6120367.1 hypothetical protein [Kitasatospora sp. GAS204B]
MTHRSTSRSRAHLGRGFGRILGAASAGLLALTLTAGCGGPQDTVKTLGKVPIPTPPASPIVPTAAPGHAQLVAMGDPVQLALDGWQGRITATGPDLVNAAPSQGAAPNSSSPGTITVALSVPTGSQQLSADSLVATDELSHPIALTPDAAAATATPGHDAVLHFSGTFAAGHATLTWRQAGKPIATWDFEVELD